MSHRKEIVHNVGDEFRCPLEIAALCTLFIRPSLGLLNICVPIKNCFFVLVFECIYKSIRTIREQNPLNWLSPSIAKFFYGAQGSRMQRSTT